MDTDFIKNITPEEIEKYKMLASIFGNNSTARLEQITLQTLVNESIAFAERNRAPKTCEGLKLVCKHLLRYFSPLRNVETIQLKDAECFLDSLKKNAPKGIYNYRRVLRAMWNKAKDWNYVRENPFEKVKLQKRQVMKPVYLTQEMLEKVIMFIEKEVIRDIVITAFYTGLRLGEIVRITFQDINLRSEIITVGSETFQTKTRKQRIVPMHSKVKEILLRKLKIKNEKLKSEGKDHSHFDGIATQCDTHKVTGFVFGKPNGYCFTTDYVSKQFKKACRKAGIDEAIHFHSIRHGSITRMIVNGANLPTVQRVAGHANVQTTMIYTHPDLENLREAVNRL